MHVGPEKWREVKTTPNPCTPSRAIKTTSMPMLPIFSQCVYPLPQLMLLWNHPGGSPHIYCGYIPVLVLRELTVRREVPQLTKLSRTDHTTPGVPPIPSCLGPLVSLLSASSLAMSLWFAFPPSSLRAGPGAASLCKCTPHKAQTRCPINHAD